MKKLCFFFVAIFMTVCVSAQNNFRINGTQYPSTSTWRMYNSKYTVDVLIVKKSDGTGYLIAGAQSGLLDDFDVIGGPFYVYLSDGSSIKCIDRKRYGSINGIMTNYYNLTKDEISTLKNSNITGVMFSIGFYNTYFKTVENMHSFSASYYGDTKYDVQQLFK